MKWLQLKKRVYHNCQLWIMSKRAISTQPAAPLSGYAQVNLGHCWSACRHFDRLLLYWGELGPIKAKQNSPALGSGTSRGIFALKNTSQHAAKSCRWAGKLVALIFSQQCQIHCCLLRHAHTPPSPSCQRISFYREQAAVPYGELGRDPSFLLL